MHTSFNLLNSLDISYFLSWLTAYLRPGRHKPASDTRMPDVDGIPAAAVHGMTTMKSVPSPVSLLMP